MASRPSESNPPFTLTLDPSEPVDFATSGAALTAALEQLADGALLLEPHSSPADMRVTYANRALAQVLALPPGELIAKTLGALFPDALAEAPELARDLARGRATRAPLAAGAYELSLSPVRDDHDRLRSWFGLVRDVRAERARARAELERAELRAAELITGSLRHEINNPLASLTTDLEWLLTATAALREASPSPGAGLDAQLQSISSALMDALAGVVRIDATMQELSILSGASEARPDLIDVRVVLSAAVLELEGRVARDIVFARDFAPVPPVVASEKRLRIAFVHLMHNAALALEGGERVVTLRTRNYHRVRVEVQDSGQGVAKEVAGRLFSPFVTTRAPGSGKGLGLFLCRKIVESHGGSVGFESAPGRGSTFWIELPKPTPPPGTR